jgi:chemotaxis signal transduction protein
MSSSVPTFDLRRVAGSWLLFRAGSRDYALPLDALVEIVAGRPPQLIPLVPVEVGGILNCRGEPIPVVDGGLVLEGLRSGSTRHALVFERDDLRVGLLVDHVLRIDRELDPSRLSGVEAPQGSHGACEAWKLTSQGRELGIVNTESLLSRATDLLVGHGVQTKEDPCHNAF